MAKVGTIVVASFLTVGSAVLLYKLFNKTSDLALLANKFGFDVAVKRPSMSGTSLIVPVEVTVSNPTKASLTVEKPYVEVLFNPGNGNKVVAKTTLPADGKVPTIEIRPQTKSLISLKLEVPIISNIGTFKDIIMRLVEGADVSSWSGLLALPSQISASLDKLLPYFSIDLTTYIGNTPINKSISLG